MYFGDFTVHSSFWKVKKAIIHYWPLHVASVICILNLARMVKEPTWNFFFLFTSGSDVHVSTYFHASPHLPTLTIVCGFARCACDVPWWLLCFTGFFLRIV